MSNEETEQPLDPAVERIRKKTLRLFAVSIGIMMIGLMTVLFAIVYKITNPTSKSLNAGETVELDIGLSSGSVVKSTYVNRDRVLIHTENPDGTNQLVVVDENTGDILARFNLK